MTIRLLEGAPAEMRELQRVLEEAPVYAHRVTGVPPRAYALLEQYIRDWRTCDRVRIGVVRSNAEVIPFWTRLGFEPTGEVKPYRYGSVASETVVFQKRLPGTP